MVSLLPSPAVIATKVVLILGANSAVAKVYASLLEKHGTPVVKVTRKECDLLDSASVAQYIIQQRAESVHFAYAIHFATTYSSADVKMARNVADLVDGLEIPRLIFTSSWVVLLQDALVSGTPYIAAKRECERLLKEHWESTPSRLRIVRISVAIGDQRLLHDKLLRKLAPFASLLPGNMRRCFINVHELCEAMQAIALEPKGLQTHSILGALRKVSDMALELAMLSPGPRGEKLCTYFKGWSVHEFAPSSQSDLLSLVSPHNLPYVQFVGGGAIRNAWGCIETQRVVVSTRNFRGVVEVGQQSVVCKSGTPFKELLDHLAARDLAPTVVPNYSYISIGAATLGPVHGSSLELPLCAQSIGWVQWYNTTTCQIRLGTISELHEEQRQNEGDFITPAVVVLQVEMALSPYHLGTHRYEQSCQQVPLTGANVVELLRDTSHTNVELRKNICFKENWSLYTYCLTDANGGPVKKVWDLFQKVGLWRSGLWLTNAFKLSSGEMFVNEKDFRRLIDDVMENRMNWGLKLFKILARPVCIGKEGEFEWYAVDFAHWIDGSNVQWVADFYQRYPSCHLHEFKMHPSITTALELHPRGMPPFFGKTKESDFWSLVASNTVTTESSLLIRTQSQGADQALATSLLSRM